MIKTSSLLSPVIDFTVREWARIKPVLDASLPGLSDKLIEQSGIPSLDESRRDLLRQALTIYAEQILTLKNDRCQSEQGQHILLTVTDTAGAIVAAPLLEALRIDPRVSRISIYGNGLGLQKLRSENKLEGFSSEIAHPGSIYKSLLCFAEQHQGVDVLLTTVSSEIGPQGVGSLNAKTLFSAKKMLLLVDGWSGLGGIYGYATEARNQFGTDWLNYVDKILVNDALAGEMAQHTACGLLKDFPTEKIIVTGTAQNHPPSHEKIVAAAQQGRQILGLEGTEFTVLYLGDVASGYGAYPAIDPNFERHSIVEVMTALNQLARLNPTESIKLLFRPHPADPEGADLLIYAKALVHMRNLEVIDSSRARIGIEPAVAVSRLELSVNSTEIMKANLWGTRGLFMKFPGAGDIVHHTVLSEPVRATYDTISVHNVEELVSAAQALMNTPATSTTAKEASDSTTRILAELFD